MTRVLVLAPNWLGDAVMALPAIADVRAAMPDATVGVAARAGIRPLFELVPAVNTVVDVERLGHAAWDTALLLPNSFRAAWLARRAGIPERWGYRGQWRAALLTRRVAPPAKPLHQAAYYQRLTAELGCPGEPRAPRIAVTPAMRTDGARVLAAAGWRGAPLVALAPGAAYGGAKRWPADRFAAVARRLAEDGVGSVLIGSRDDAATGWEVERALGQTRMTMNLVGKTSLNALAGVLARCRTLVTNDSGAMHFAAALGVGVVALFGPTDERYTSPMAAVPESPVVVLTHQAWCRPCMLRECPIDHRCMRGIEVGQVLTAARRAS